MSWLEEHRGKIIFFASILMLVGMLFSKALISISIIILGLQALITIDYKSLLKDLIKNKFLGSLVLYYLLIVISGCYSTDTKEYWKVVQMNLPFLILPLVSLSLPKGNIYIDKYRRVLVLIGGILVLVASSFPILGLVQNIDQLAFEYSRGKVIELPINHIRFSLMSALLALLNFQSYFIERKKTNLVVAILLFVLLHVIAVRSGLLAFYVTGLAWFVFVTIKSRKWLRFLTLTFMGMVALVLAISFIPTLNSKYRYTMYDFQQYQKNASDKMNYSDARRFISYKVGYEALKANWVLGVGAGDLKYDIHEIYKMKYPEIDAGKRMLPHNQILRSFVSLGFLGALLVLVMSLFPLIAIKRNIGMFLSGSVFFISFLMEGTLGTQLGLSLFLFFTLLFYDSKTVND